MPRPATSTTPGERLPDARDTAIARVGEGAKTLVVVGALVYAAALVIGFALVGRHGGGAIQELDNAVGRWFLSHRSIFVGVSKFIATYFDALPLGVGCFVISVLLAWRFRSSWAVMPFLSYLGGEALVTATRLVIHRPRPLTAIYPAPGSIRGMDETSYSFPSGHSVAVTAVLFAMLGFVALARRAWWPWMIAAVGASFVAFSRLVLGVHWFSDALFGVMFGAAWGTAVALVAHRVDKVDLRALVHRVAKLPPR